MTDHPRHDRRHRGRPQNSGECQDDGGAQPDPACKTAGGLASQAGVVRGDYFGATGSAVTVLGVLWTLGGLSARSTQFVKLAGREARCELIAASIANGIQTLDTFAQIEHVGPGTTTRELFRGIATERGKLGFNGKMIVRDSALDADSDQSLKTLLTGAGAAAAARPQLEIYTDRVRARHGATTGKLDDQMLFYLLSRGIDRQQAQALLQWAFIEDAVSQVELAPLRHEIEQLVAAQLNEVSALDGLVAAP